MSFFKDKKPFKIFFYTESKHLIIKLTFQISRFKVMLHGTIRNDDF